MGLGIMGVLWNLLIPVIFFAALFFVVRAAILSAEKKKAEMWAEGRPPEGRSTPRS